MRRLPEQRGPFEVILPAVSSVRALTKQGLATWPLTPHIVSSEADKFASFKLARAALAASGTVTLELALTGTPMVVAYIADALAVKQQRLHAAETASRHVDGLLHRASYRRFVEARGRDVMEGRCVAGGRGLSVCRDRRRQQL